jgi:hypothetical protein
MPTNYGGLQWENFRVVNGDYPPLYGTGLKLGRVSAPNTAYNANATPATISSATSFDVISAYFAVAYSSTDQPSEVQIEGFAGRWLKYTTRVSATDYYPTFATLNFYGIDRLVFTSLVNPHDGRISQFVLDNFTFAWPVPPPPPAAPTGLTATAMSSNQIDLQWTDASDNETGFRIERCTGAGCTNFALLVGVSANVASYSDKGLSPSTRYRYRVLAYNGSLQSGYSNIAETTTLALTVPAAPSHLTATAASSSQVNLAWTDHATNETGFKIERCTGAGCTTFAQIATTGAGVTSYANTGLAASTTYTYRVRAYNGAGNSGYAGAASATTPATPAQSLHVGDLDGSSEGNDNTWIAVITITVHTAAHAPLAGAKVTATWSAGATGTASCTTDTSGECTVTKANLSPAIASVTLTVTNVTKAGWSYSAGGNHDPDGDSNGTRYVVSRPHDF